MCMAWRHGLIDEKEEGIRCNRNEDFVMDVWGDIINVCIRIRGGW